MRGGDGDVQRASVDRWLEPVGRVDLAYLLFKILIEYKGDQHRTDRGQWNFDINRMEAFTDLGFTVIRVTAQRVRRPRDVVLRIDASCVSMDTTIRRPASTLSQPRRAGMTSRSKSSMPLRSYAASAK